MSDLINSMDTASLLLDQLDAMDPEGDREEYSSTLGAVSKIYTQVCFTPSTGPQELLRKINLAIRIVSFEYGKDSPLVVILHTIDADVDVSDLIMVVKQVMEAGDEPRH